MSKKSQPRKANADAPAKGKPVPPPPRRRVPLKMSRQCGECTACCIVFDIPELEKERGVPCPMLKTAPDRAGMCSIYDAPTADFNTEDAAERASRGEVWKPKTCHEFRCLWLNGDLPENLYPALSGVVFKLTKDRRKISVFEMETDASRRPECADFIATLTENGVPVIVIGPKEPGHPEPLRRLIRPPVGLNPDFDRELVAMAMHNPAAFLPGK